MKLELIEQMNIGLCSLMLSMTTEQPDTQISDQLKWNTERLTLRVLTETNYLDVKSQKFSGDIRSLDQLWHKLSTLANCATVVLMVVYSWGGFS